MANSKIPDNILLGWQMVVIDDEPDSLEVAQIILETYGATVHTAVNGAIGLAVVRKVRPRCIICDISMPVLDGWGFIHTLKRDRALLDIPCIALTAHAMVGDRERAIAAGFHNYLTKPLTAGAFIQDLLRLLIDIPELSQFLNIEKED